MNIVRLAPMALFAIALSSTAPLLFAQQDAATPDITVRQEEDRTIREYRINGQLYAIEIQPAQGPAYYLVDDDGDGDFQRSDAQRVTPPSWVLISW